MSNAQLLFEGHLAEAKAPGVFKILEPFPIDGNTWSEINSCSGKTLFMLDGKAVAFTTNDEGFYYLHNNKATVGILWDESHDSGNPLCIGGVTFGI